MFSEVPVISSAKTAAAMPNGTINVTTKALVKPSNCAAQHQENNGQRDQVSHRDLARRLIKRGRLTEQQQRNVGWKNIVCQVSKVANGCRQRIVVGSINV